MCALQKFFTYKKAYASLLPLAHKEYICTSVFRTATQNNTRILYIESNNKYLHIYTA